MVWQACGMMVWYGMAMSWDDGMLWQACGMMLWQACGMMVLYDSMV